jgi:hypothetical protein
MLFGLNLDYQVRFTVISSLKTIAETIFSINGVDLKFLFRLILFIGIIISINFNPRIPSMAVPLELFPPFDFQKWKQRCHSLE